MTDSLPDLPPPRRGRRRRRLLRALVVLLVLYAVAVTVGGGCIADALVLRPPGGRIGAGGAERMVLPAAGRRGGGGDLEIWCSHSPAATDGRADALVLEFCGNATRAEQIAQYVPHRWRRFAVETWVVNYPGYGGSAGRPHIADIPPAALDAYDALAKRAAGRPIFLEANSLGTTAALYVAAHRPVAGLVLQNPPPLRQVIYDHGWWNLYLLAAPVAMQIPHELDSPANAAHVTAPAVFLMADHDELVRPKLQRLVVDAYAGPKRIVPLVGLHHGDSVNGPAEASVQAALDWLWSKSVKPTTQSAAQPAG